MMLCSTYERPRGLHGWSCLSDAGCRDCSGGSLLRESESSVIVFCEEESRGAPLERIHTAYLKSLVFRCTQPLQSLSTDLTFF